MSATSSTRSDARRDVRTFATLRIVGDDLVPEQITKFLKLVPTQAYAKGELYDAGLRSGRLRGRTGVWYLSTDRLVASDRLIDHLGFLQSVLIGAPYARGQTPDQLIANITHLKQLIHRKSLRAIVTCFWDGPAGAKPPTIPRSLASMFKAIPIEIDIDFDTDEAPPTRVRAIARG